MYRNSRGGNQLMSLQKCANFSDCGPISTTDTPILVEIGLSYPILGPVSLTVFPSQLKFDGNFASPPSRFEYSDRYKILYMAWQLCCRGMCKNLLQSDGQNGITARRSFHRIWIAGKKLLVKWAPVLSRVVSWLFSMFSGVFCLRLKPYLVVKIASDVLTQHCCQVCILAMMFCHSDCWLCAGMCGKWLRNQGNSSYQCTTCFGLLTCWHSDRPHGIWKIFFTFDFHILP